MNISDLPKNISDLPRDVIPLVFENLSIPQIGVAAKVCKDWNASAKKETLWKQLIKRDFKKEPSPEILKNRTYKTYYQHQVWETLQVDYYVMYPPVDYEKCYTLYESKNYAIRDAHKNLIEDHKNHRTFKVVKLTIKPNSSQGEKGSVAPKVIEDAPKIFRKALSIDVAAQRLVPKNIRYYYKASSSYFPEDAKGKKIATFSGDILLNVSKF